MENIDSTEWKQERHFNHKCYLRYWITPEEHEQFTALGKKVKSLESDHGWTDKQAKEYLISKDKIVTSLRKQMQELEKHLQKNITEIAKYQKKIKNLARKIKKK